MKKQYFIIVDMKSPDGFLEFAKFYLGEEIDFGQSVFSALQFVDDTDSAVALRMELMEVKEGINEVLETRYCTLKQLKENCELITKEVFRYFIF